MIVKAKQENRHLVIKHPLLKKFRPSRSGKSMVVLSTRGFRRSGITINGHELRLNITGIIKKPSK